MMHIQTNKRIVGYFRPNRKCPSFSGCLLLIFILMVSIAKPSAARPNQDEDLPHHFEVADDFRDADNLEIHHVKMVDGVPEEAHPIIIYKEDFVSEDYVPPKNETKSDKHKRRYKNIDHRRVYKKQNFTDVIIEENAEKMLFDIIPEKPLIVPEDMEKHRKSHMKLVPLIKTQHELNDTGVEESSLKEELLKRPKKFHRRIRRSANEDHILRKRNPYFRHVPKIVGEVPAQLQYIYVKHSVAGKKHNGLDIPIAGPRPAPTSGPNDNMPISFENRVAADENDRVIFSGGRRTTTSTTTESIFRDPRPENFDFSFMNPQRRTTITRRPEIPATEESIFRDPRPENFDFSFMNNQRRTTTTRRPETGRQEESIFRDPRPQNFDFSFMNPQVQQSSFVSASATTSRPQLSTQAIISQCVWAIVNCCSPPDSEIRYACFEQNGCFGAFWDLNPCADNVRDNIINFVADYYK